uniref:Uncharacterized protein n=1 Tax=Tetraselmis chuii TaxID=63592 RepID=A0A7S1SXV8_9CHLO|mmetsp:Transcript_34153/g.60980  ORF Transcript_34153/g.60980 Transcript_34153/m.60980 type:complete len:267 (+) Transcript_34153:62-862(+)
MVLDRLPAQRVAVPGGSMVTKNFAQVMGATNTGELVGGERRKMEKQLRLARVSAILLGSYDKYKEDNAKPPPSRESSYAGTSDGNPDEPEVDEQLLDCVAELAPGVPKDQLVAWALSVNKKMGFADSYRAQVSIDFILIQSVDMTADIIQRAWRAYVERRDHVDPGLMASMMDEGAFGWKDTDPTEFVPESVPRKGKDKAKPQEVKARRGSFVDKTFSATQRENETKATASRIRRKSETMDMATADSYVHQARAAMARLQKPSEGK